LISGFDVVFCRNVMIYFSEEAKKQVVRGFYNSMHPGGYLYIGHSETLHGISKAFKLVYFKNGLVYQKEERVAEKESRPNPPSLLTSTTGLTSGAGKAIDLLSKIKTGSAKS